ncbi:C-Myc-binding protein isoform X3 [Pipistrellus kuhlii]|uniref:C-Myc-binding protein isoform X3 n=1 Tax=Pipistrellus kuhlii TaxID=59472 RepID=UPI001E26F47A|nr:C-Myc-binding protein isoform X3 [Pipistrellus kuhlii]
MKTDHAPAVPGRGPRVRRRARPPAHEQCCSEPASHGLRRQLRRRRCHYGPLQSEGGAAAWLGACGRWPAAGRLRAADSKREQFRRYLEKSGVLDTLTKACSV